MKIIPEMCRAVFLHQSILINTRVSTYLLIIHRGCIKNHLLWALMLFYILLFVSDEDYSRNVSFAQHLITRYLYFKIRNKSGTDITQNYFYTFDLITENFIIVKEYNRL
jgi:hypothetical protein